MLRLLLRDGFHGHSVLVTMNGIEVYRAAGVTTDGVTACAATVEVSSPERRARLAVRVSPGDLASAVEVDLARHPHVAISLVGTGTVALEASATPLP